MAHGFSRGPESKASPWTEWPSLAAIEVGVGWNANRGAAIRANNNFGDISLLSRRQELVVATHPVSVQEIRRAGLFLAPKLLLGPLHAVLCEIDAAGPARDDPARRHEKRIGARDAPAIHRGSEGRAVVGRTLDRTIANSEERTARRASGCREIVRRKMRCAIIRAGDAPAHAAIARDQDSTIAPRVQHITP